MTATAPGTLPEAKRTRYPGTGRPAKITVEIASRVAERCAKGLPLRYALAQDELILPFNHFEDALKRDSKLSRVFDKIVADWMTETLGKINEATCKTLPGSCWTLERAHREYFGANAKGTQVNVNVNTVIGLGDDVLKRAAAHLRGGSMGRHDGRGMKRATVQTITDAKPSPNLE